MYKFTALEQRLLNTGNPDYLAMLGDTKNKDEKNKIESLIATRQTAKQTKTQRDFELYKKALAEASNPGKI